MIKPHSQARSFRHGLTMSLSCAKSLAPLLALVFLFLVSVGCVYGNVFYTDHDFKPPQISGFSRGKIDVFELTWFKWPLSLATLEVNSSFWLTEYRGGSSCPNPLESCKFGGVLRGQTEKNVS